MIWFRLQYIAENFGLEEGRILNFQDETHNGASIELTPIVDKELYRGSKKGDILCTGLLNRKPTRQISQWLQHLDATLPNGFEEFATDSANKLNDSITMLLKLLRWRIGKRKSRNPIRYHHSFMWSENGNEWKSTGIPLQFRFQAEIYRTVDDEIVSSVNEFWHMNIGEPLAHELFQEAWSQISNNPKSALVIGVAAAETGMKHLAAKLVPHSTWLIMNTQSPPLVKMLKELLPQLPTSIIMGGVALPPLPKMLISTVEKAVKLRNDIVHGKEVKLEYESLYSMLKIIDDLLYIFDLYSGHLWAIKFISCETEMAWLRH